MHRGQELARKQPPRHRQRSYRRAYPFVALAFAVVPLLSWMVFRDSLDLRYGFGLALVLGGLYLVASGR